MYFGSYARGDYKTTSDIDICIIADKKPPSELAGDLRMRAEELGADIVFLTPAYFENSQDLFAKNIRRPIILKNTFCYQSGKWSRRASKARRIGAGIFKRFLF
ncbi:nucleotidyltransferase domain-containing protein [Lachnospiraceae bacterium ZAX-1]